jgi:calcineurin-like phosphoesterase family protein
MKEFFTSDTHFGHRNIIGYCNRPYPDVSTMNQKLVDNWNNRVSDNDEVYFLGDFAFLPKDEAQLVFDLLNGKKYLVIGNHDQVGKKLIGWEWVKSGYTLAIDKYNIQMSHYPDGSWFPFSKYHYYFHGHCHNAYGKQSRKNHFDVGVDCWNYQPITFEEILKS